MIDGEVVYLALTINDLPPATREEPKAYSVSIPAATTQNHAGQRGPAGQNHLFPPHLLHETIAPLLWNCTSPSSHWQQVLCQAIGMAEKRTKADMLQRNVEQLATRDEARRESQINDKRSEPTSKIPDPTQLEEQISRRAYELYEARGREHGHDREDWLQAEAEILDRETAPIIEEPETDKATRQTESRAPQTATAA